MLSDNLFNVNPHSLRVDKRDYRCIYDLYDRYKDQLQQLCSQMSVLRKSMVEQGHSADFSDREAEILYLVLRALKPEVVVEISPCHGYSTNYILAALTANKKGHLYSYEIQEEHNSKPIADVIKGNLCSCADRDRLTLKVGDVRDSDLPPCDFLFIDSNHEAYFASWYLSGPATRPKFIFVHDILIAAGGSLVPKAPFLGIKEQYYLLEFLGANNQKLFSVAEFDLHLEQEYKRLPSRYRNAPERSVIFKGSQQTGLSKSLHRGQDLLYDAEKMAFMGDRGGALDRINKICREDFHFFTRLEAVLLLARMGYRKYSSGEVFPKIDIAEDKLTVSELVTLLETHIASCDLRSLHRLIKEGRRSGIDPATYKYIAKNYLRITGSGRLNGALLSKLAKRLLRV